MNVQITQELLRLTKSLKKIYNTVLNDWVKMWKLADITNILNDRVYILS